MTRQSLESVSLKTHAFSDPSNCEGNYWKVMRPLNNAAFMGEVLRVSVNFLR